MVKYYSDVDPAPKSYDLCNLLCPLCNVGARLAPSPIYGPTGLSYRSQIVVAWRPSPYATVENCAGDLGPRRLELGRQIRLSALGIGFSSAQASNPGVPPLGTRPRTIFSRVNGPNLANLPNPTSPIGPQVGLELLDHIQARSQASTCWNDQHLRAYSKKGIAYRMQ